MVSDQVDKSIDLLYLFPDKEYSTDDNVPVVEIYGSYKDNKPLFQGTSEVELKQELDSAIKETTD